MEHLSRILARPVQYRDSVHATFFVLSIPTLWELVYDGYIVQGDFAAGVAKLRTFFRLFSSCEESATIHLPQEHEGTSESENEDERVGLSMIRAIKIRGKVGPTATTESLEVLCPAFLDLISASPEKSGLDLSSCYYDTALRGKKWKKKHEEEEEWEEPWYEEEELPSEESDSVEYQGDSPAKWFFFSRYGWTQFLTYCIEHLWNGESSLVSSTTTTGERVEEPPSLFDLIVLELFMHGYTAEEFYRLRKASRERLRSRCGAATHTVRPVEPVEPSDVERKGWIRTQEVLACGLRKCGYWVSGERTSEQREIGWNPFGCVVLLLEQGLYLGGLESKVSESSGCGLLMDYLTRTPGGGLEAAPVDLSVRVQRKGIRVYGLEHDVIRSFHVTRYGDAMFLPEMLPGFGWQYFSGRNISSHVADVLYMFGRSPTGFL
jgi:hypothetical protein